MNQSTISWSNDTEVEDYNKCRKCSMEHQRGSHVVNTKISSSQNVKMHQGHELPGNPLSHGLCFKFRIQVYISILKLMGVNLSLNISLNLAMKP